MAIISTYVYFFFGIAALLVAADRFVAGSVAISHKLKIPTFLVGLTIVAIGTSAPELFISIMAGVSSQGMLAIGDAIGSNMANIGLINGLIFIFVPACKVHKTNYVIALLNITAIVAAIIFYYKKISYIDGWILLGLGFFCFMIKYFVAKKQQTNNAHVETPVASTKLGYVSILSFVFGLIGMPVAAKITTSAAVDIAKEYQLSEYIIGVVLLAISTSLPELATSFIAATKKQYDIAIANVVGSNIVNMTFVLAPIGFLSPTTLPANFFVSESAPLLLMTLVYSAILLWGRNLYLVRLQGMLLLAGYIQYLVLQA